MDDDALREQIATFQRAIRTWPTVLLDNFYIQVDVAEAYRRFAERAGKAPDDLTEQERVAAFLAAYIARITAPAP